MWDSLCVRPDGIPGLRQPHIRCHGTLDISSWSFLAPYLSVVGRGRMVTTSSARSGSGVNTTSRSSSSCPFPFPPPGDHSQNVPQLLQISERSVYTKNFAASHSAHRRGSGSALGGKFTTVICSSEKSGGGPRRDTTLPPPLERSRGAEIPDHRVNTISYKIILRLVQGTLCFS